MLEKVFKLSENQTTLRTEVLAGITTFMTMAYIIFVNPAILSDAGMPFGAVLVATCVSAAFATLLMGLLANYPFALAPGMGLNAYFTYSVVLGAGLSWQAALAAVFISGLIFLLLTLTRAREAIVNAIPMSLKLAVSAGIGLFIALIGFKNAGFIVPNENTLVALGDFSDPKVLLAAIGFVVTGLLVVKRVKGALLLGIIITTLIGIPMGITNIENFRLVSMPPSVAETFGAFRLGFKEVLDYGIIPIIFAFTFVDLFDTIGTLVGVSSKAGMLDERGHLPRASRALLADSLGTVVGSVMGTSTVTTYIESASGVAEGGRTGLTAVITALLFLVALFFSPLVGIIPGQATAPILIIVGIFMMEPVMKIDFTNYLEAIPAFLAIVMMPFTFSIAEGIVFGVLAYTILRFLAGRWQEVSLTMWVLTVLFVIRFFVG
ncbi:NCS2 family permease [Calderihabitans maritimus]|uniref:Permeases n=1 Tax=Calderihabitans maritimus TaxID=1246530 RepID=A0A1Z5HRN6_9FIRM|nr:NCS2 family permease [Calderihabitans maritimus]GAW92174.1 permeases [Calderihabitans maritimus]